MQVPVQDLLRHNAAVAGDLSETIQAVLKSGWFVLGKQVTAFEEEFAAYLKARYCVSVANGTDALELAMRAVGVKPGKQVILAANAGGYSTVATLAIGATPAYVDIGPDHYGINPDEVARKLESDKGKIGAVVLTHLYGEAGPIENIARQCDDANVPLIEDCAEAHGARVQGRAVGTWGTVGCFSFYPTKNLGALGDGGACVTNDPTIASRLKLLRQYGWERRYHATIPGGRNSRLDEMQAAILRRKLLRLDDWNARRRAIARTYNRALQDKAVRVPRIEEQSYVGHLYVIEVHNRDAFRARLEGEGVRTDVHFPTPDYLQPGFAQQLSEPDCLPQTETVCSRTVTLPCFPEMTDEEVAHVAAVAQRALSAS